MNVTLLMPETQRAKRAGFVIAPTELYGSPGRLVDYRRQFKKTAPKEREDPSIFTIDLETLAVNTPVRPDGDHPRSYGDRTATRKCTRSPANVNTTPEKVSKNYKLKQSCVLTAFLLRSYCVLTAFLLRSYHVLTARPPRPLRAYGVSCEIFGLGNGDHGRSRGALTMIMGFLPRVFYVYRECTATSGRFYHVLTATIY